MNRKLCAIAIASTCAAISLYWQTPSVHGAPEANPSSISMQWNPQNAASYLDTREVWWQSWEPAQKDHGTLCISCHTVVPYALARPVLRRELNEPEPTAPESVLYRSVEKRAGSWSKMVPFYSDAANGPGKTAESHSTEAVLNAVILASYDARHGHLRPITVTALNDAWALQLATGERAGGWLWQDFHLAPWESANSAYQGAALLTVAIGKLPDGYVSDPKVRPHMYRLISYLQREFAAQPLLNQVYVLWASARVPGLLTAGQRTGLLTQLHNLQQPDGGWRLASLDNWKRVDDSNQPTGTDALATSLAVLAMEVSGTAKDDSSLQMGLAWLNQHQQKDGAWLASSMNKERDPESNIGRFMSDAATGYAVLALENAY